MLNFQDFSLVLVPSMRLNCLPRARRERAALRAHREEKEKRAAAAGLPPRCGRALTPKAETDAAWLVTIKQKMPPP